MKIWKTDRQFHILRGASCRDIASSLVVVVWFWNYHCQNQGGMCYRHKLTWAESKMGLKQKIKNACKSAPASVFGPHGPCIFGFGSRLEIESNRDKISLDCFPSLRTINMYLMLFMKKGSIMTSRK